MSRTRVTAHDGDHINVSWTTLDGYIVSIVEDKRRLEVWVWNESAPDEREVPRPVGEIEQGFEVVTEWLAYLRAGKAGNFNRSELEDE